MHKNQSLVAGSSAERPAASKGELLAPRLETKREQQQPDKKRYCRGGDGDSHAAIVVDAGTDQKIDTGTDKSPEGCQECKGGCTYQGSNARARKTGDGRIAGKTILVHDGMKRHARGVLGPVYAELRSNHTC